MEESPQGLPAAAEFRDLRFLSAAALLAAGCGLVGAGFSLLVLAVERLAYGFTTGTFAEAITEVGPLHRFAVVVASGVLVAAAWHLVRRSGPAIPAPPAILTGTAVPMRWMLADTALQVVNVAAGGSIGREGAPRQVGALSGFEVSGWLRSSAAQRRLLVAAGTGAGLAAIYNVPIGGALFACEVMLGLALLRRSRPSAVVGSVITVLAVAALASVVARIAVPNRPTYSFLGDVTDPRLLLVALVGGPVLGSLGYAFGALVDRAVRAAPKGASLLWTMPLCYLGLALLALPLPLVLGNGHALAQQTFAGALPLSAVALLVIAKPLATLLTVRAGATGGRLTPSLATGAAAGAVLAGVLQPIWPVPVATVAVLGAAAVLTGAMPAPLTAAALVIEFTGFSAAGWPLVVIAVGGAWVASRLLDSAARRPDRQRPRQ